MIGLTKPLELVRSYEQRRLRPPGRRYFAPELFQQLIIFSKRMIIKAK
jgi:hypothetical protein